MNQRELVLKYIEDFGSITSYDAVKDLGIIELPKRVSELRKLGFDIVGTQEKSINRYGKPCHYHRYTLRASA